MYAAVGNNKKKVCVCAGVVSKSGVGRKIVPLADFLKVTFLQCQNFHINPSRINTLPRCYIVPLASIYVFVMCMYVFMCEHTCADAHAVCGGKGQW